MAKKKKRKEPKKFGQPDPVSSRERRLGKGNNSQKRIARRSEQGKKTYD